MYKAVDEGQFDWPLTSATDPLPLRRASLLVRLPEETPSYQIHAQFQLDGTPVTEGEHDVSGTRVSLYWHGGAAQGQALDAVALDVEVIWNARFAGELAKTEGHADFIASLNPDHEQAALNLLAFAQSMAQQAAVHDPRRRDH